MDIEQFVSESLRQISRGVLEARNEKGISISPQTMVGRDNTAGSHAVTMSHHYPVLMVEFDLSVAVQSKLEGGASGGLTVLGIGGKADASSSIDHTRIQRIKFEVPVTFVRPQKESNAG